MLAQIEVDPPDAVILNVRMPPTYTDEGLSVAERLRERHPELAILVLSAYVDPSDAARLLARAVGDWDFSKDRVAALDTLVDALTRLTAGETVIDEQIVAALFRRPPGRATWAP